MFSGIVDLSDELHLCYHQELLFLTIVKMTLSLFQHGLMSPLNRVECLKKSCSCWPLLLTASVGLFCWPPSLTSLQWFVYSFWECLSFSLNCCDLVDLVFSFPVLCWRVTSCVISCFTSCDCLIRFTVVSLVPSVHWICVFPSVCQFIFVRSYQTFLSVSFSLRFCDSDSDLVSLYFTCIGLPWFGFCLPRRTVLWFWSSPPSSARKSWTFRFIILIYLFNCTDTVEQILQRLLENESSVKAKRSVSST